ncbi:MAG TPA: PaaI family thioesterase [Gaiella sp.]
MAGERSLTITWHDPHDVAARIAGLDGLEAMRRMAAGEIPYPPITSVIAARLVEVDAGRVVWEAEPAEHLYNPIGTVHGGFAMTLLDSAMGTAFVSTATAGTRWTTLELKANFTRAITAETGVVRCTGTVVHRGRKVVTTEARAEDSGDRLLAHATSTILVLDP